MRAALRLHTGPFFADIIHDQHDTNIWIYVVQREGSPDILALGSCTTETGARDVAQRIMKDMQQNGEAAAAS